MTKECAVHLRLIDSIDDECVVVVVSHDCDIAQSASNEPNVEVIVGKLIGTIEGNYAHGKNARQLHVPCLAGRDEVVVALEAAQKTIVPKERAGGPALSDYEPCERIKLRSDERRTLQRWLAARYLRSAFPDEFDSRLESTKVRERLEKALKVSDEHIAAVFFDVDGGVEVPRTGADDPFELEITLLYSTAADPGVAREAASTLAARIEEIFDSRCRKTVDGTKHWHSIELVGVHVVSDQAMTVAQSQRLSKWNADHLSLRSDPHGPLLDPA